VGQDGLVIGGGRGGNRSRRSDRALQLIKEEVEPLDRGGICGYNRCDACGRGGHPTSYSSPDSSPDSSPKSSPKSSATGSRCALKSAWVAAARACGPPPALLVQHLDFGTADSGAFLQKLEVFLETTPLLGRAQLHEVRLQPVEVFLDLLVCDQLEHTELVELGRGVENEISSRHVAGAADLVADPGVNLGDNHLGGYLEELRRSVCEDHGRDLVG